MKECRVTFTGLSGRGKSINRMEKSLKNLYWEKGKEPNNWADFENEIEIKDLNQSCADTFIIRFDSSMGTGWVDSIIQQLSVLKDVQSVEVKVKNEYGDMMFERI